MTVAPRFALVLASLALAAALAGCTRKGPAPGTPAEQCVAPDGSLQPGLRADAYLKLLADLEKVGLELNGVDASARVVYVPRDLCHKKPVPAAAVEAKRLLKSRHYDQPDCDPPPIIIVSACLQNDRVAPAEAALAK